MSRIYARSSLGCSLATVNTLTVFPWGMTHTVPTLVVSRKQSYRSLSPRLMSAAGGGTHTATTSTRSGREPAPQ